MGWRGFLGVARLQNKLTDSHLTTWGRKEDLKLLLQRIERHDCNLTIIYGQSGVGKSSLLEAALIPRIKAKDRRSASGCSLVTASLY